MAVPAVKTMHWEVFPSMSTRRVYCTALYQDGQVFVLGGCSETGLPLDKVEMLDVVSQKWTGLPPMPTPRAGAAAVVLSKQLLIIGGMNEEQSPLGSLEVFNMDEGKWEKKAPLGQPSMGITAVKKDDKVFALGGMGSDAAPQALVRLYDPARDQWQSLPPMPTPQYAASAFLRGNKIYVLGGRQSKLPVTAFESLDLETRSWTRYPSIPSRRAFANCTMTEKCFYSLGGLQQPGPHNFYSRPHFVNTVEVFDTDQGLWTKQSRCTRMREKRADFAVGYVGGRVVAAGGLGNQPSPLGSVEGFNPTKRKWESLPAMNCPRCSCASLQGDNMLFVIGGVSQGPSNAVEALSVRESS
ncbi:kelch domain-containing protein 8B [Callorhinchus milii]|uniref:Kelch domain-containing protein 8B n=1 Tax=Callorhinchus milii TaxID=7868 RepID=A0A4W3HJS4_CALMI|nr:kelch domain-containing protein 8B [Callorhinchus milii]|eukprot:gi/632980459/ref/XP_007907046.1/ PREDICTED: kelch domain-containing protein 8B [Callorhinchus milii]